MLPPEKRRFGAVDDRIDESVRRRHPGAERHEEWPPPPIVATRPGNPSLAPSPMHSAHKHLAAIWGVLAILAAAMVAGWKAKDYLDEKHQRVVDELSELKRTQSVNQAVIELTLTNMRGDMAEMKEALRKDRDPPPLKKPEKPR